MDIREVIEKLKKMPSDRNVFFNFCHCVPTTVDSWRGIYSELALGWDMPSYDKIITVAGLIKELESAITQKGGDFSYNLDSPLHIDNPGKYTLTEIEDIVDVEWGVIIITNNSDDD